MEHPVGYKILGFVLFDEEIRTKTHPVNILSLKGAKKVKMDSIQ